MTAAEWDYKFVHFTFRKMAIATKLFVSRMTFVHISNLQSQSILNNQSILLDGFVRKKRKKVGIRLISSSCIHTIWKCDEQHFDPTFREIGIVKELLVSFQTYVHIQNLHLQLDNLS